MAHLGRGLNVLVRARHGLAERQRTLRQTIDWSYHLLEPAAQRLFARLGIFVGSSLWPQQKRSFPQPQTG
ncbi:MAG: hypothetical protein R3E79_31615 [Caldilineaceae bacterium]